ncbi:MAG: 30S ribosome-binding factor RbfA [Thiohalophilus sp.]|uniref:30S ribosome-binding factor RbfA n=1 Tax=Thiohalophilus sp. TaxID=3028392 RepID=UPI00287054DF|nr:30S ribosome-binding factor RbfA [Thiohalophilus sp.]MDR9435418.1 30S ribosome-binding factor RbfA [Thiohalophilus sp.]
MAKDFSRTRRIGEQMQRELATLIQQEIQDPRLGMVTVSAVEVSRDLAHAKVFITVLDDQQQDIAASLDVLNRASGFLRHELGRRMILRTVPVLRFVYDESMARGNALSQLIDEAVKSDKQRDE